LNGIENAKNRVEHLNTRGYYAEEDEQEDIFITCIYFMMITLKNSKHSIRRKSRR
jgi:hypothetical protein